MGGWFSGGGDSSTDNSDSDASSNTDSSHDADNGGYDNTPAQEQGNDGSDD